MATEVARLRSINPASGAEIESFAVPGPHLIDSALDTAAAAWRAWHRTSLSRRTELLRDLAAAFRRDIGSHAATITAEMGKPITEARAEVEKCAFCCDYFADNAERFLADEAAPSDSAASFIRFDALGVVLACMPWNYPYWPRATVWS
jgi:succinate-semialdehyde dehydrogenase/glutarate-semialdehyde dehydrogenase